MFNSLQIKLKLHLLLFYPSTSYICGFFLFHIEIEGKYGWIIGGGGGAKGMLTPLQFSRSDNFLHTCLGATQQAHDVKMMSMRHDDIT